MKTTEYLHGIKNQNTTILGKSITLIESSLKKDKKKAAELIEKCIPLSGNSIRVGISGTPGVGKSTFIENLGIQLTQKYKIAVLAIDPSSELSKGSILGDKTRMVKLANSKNAFIRPSPNKGQLGGVSSHTKDAITLCEAAGFNIIFIETVGVGQSEAMVASITDFFIYLTLSQNGDQLQFIKKGTLELSDVIIINKADQNKKKVKETTLILKHTLQNMNYRKKQAVFSCSALLNTNLDKIWQYIEKLNKEKLNSGEIEKNRKNQNFFWFKYIITHELKNVIFENKKLKKQLDKIQSEPPKNPRKIAIEILNQIIREDLK